MPVMIEEVSVDVEPDRGPDETSAGPARPAPGAEDLEDRVRGMLARERRRAERLSDR